MENTHLLVFANKKDQANAMTDIEVAKELDLHHIKDRRWFICRSNALKGEGLTTGLDWLANAVLGYETPAMSLDIENSIVNDPIAPLSDINTKITDKNNTVDNSNNIQTNLKHEDVAYNATKTSTDKNDSLESKQVHDNELHSCDNMHVDSNDSLEHKTVPNKQEMMENPYTDNKVSDISDT